MNLKILSITLITGLLSFAGCKKHDDHNNNNKPLNINYPAAFVVNGQSNNIDVINLENLTRSESISLNGAKFPHHVYLSPDKTKLAVAITSTDLSDGHGGHSGGTGGYKVQIINSTTGVIEKEIPLSKLPHNAIFSPDGNELWVGQFDVEQSQVLVYNTSDWAVKNTINVGKGLSEVTFSADGKMVFAANTLDATVTMIDPATKGVRNTIAVGKDPVGAWPATNGYVYVDNETDKTISEIQVSTGTVTRTINLGFKPGYAAYHTGSQELWVSDATNGKIVYYKEVSGEWAEQGTIATGADAHAIAFSNDGATAFVTNQGANNVSVINTANHSVTSTIAFGTKPNGIAVKQ